MKNIKFKNVLYILAAYYLLFSIAVFYKSDTLANLLAPIGGYAAFGVLIYGYFKTKSHEMIKWSWLSYSLAVFCWASADLLWLIYSLIPNMQPDSSALIRIIYNSTNLFLGLGIVISGLYRLKKWNIIQLLLDISSVSICVMVLIWVFFFQKSFDAVLILQSYGITDLICVTSDFMIIIGLLTQFVSDKACKKPFLLRISCIGLLLYALTDIYFYYNSFYGLYDPNSIIDLSYMASFILISVGRYFRLRYESNIGADKIDICENLIFKHNSLILLICPLIVIIFKGFLLIDIVFLLFFILTHEIFSIYVQTAIKNEKMLKKEQENNIMLEHKIFEHAKRLEEQNKELIEKNKELFFLSNQDVVTKLYNRRYFKSILKKMVSNINNNNTVVVLFIDLDRFKTINDTYGHDIGDQVLMEVARRLEKWNRNNTVLARLGGDEFVFAFEGNYSYVDAEKFAHEIISTCSEEIKIESYSFHLTMSIGISIYPLDANDSSTMMKNADMAMYQAKSSGYNRFYCFSKVLNERTFRNNEIEILLRKADFDKEFQVVYQPQFKIPEGELVGMEALLRWKCPYIGYISPAEFIPIAEEINYIIPIGQWVMKQAIRQIAIWNNTYYSDFKMGINVSPIQLDSVEFIGELKELMIDSFVEPKWIDIEITENVAMDGEDRIGQISDLMKGLGVSVSIDDFGTGYSSLSYLKLFPSDRIKIAKSLVDSISTDDFDRQIVKAIIMLAKSIGIRTIAEGVEYQEQLDNLIKLGCEEMQGYLLGKPMPAQDFEKYFLANRGIENKSKDTVLN